MQNNNNIYYPPPHLQPPPNLSFPPNLNQSLPLPASPPEDTESKNIIDKLASFVARNGPEFENVTKEKQKDNPKFGFLSGGPYYNYYKYRVNVEIESNKQKTTQVMPVLNQMPPSMSIPPPSMSIPPPIQSQMTSQMPPNLDQATIMASLQQIPILQGQINMIKDQILQSEKNLNAQKDVFKTKVSSQIEEGLKQKKTDEYNSLLNESKIDISTFESIINRIIESCTKENISNGRNFVFNKNLNEKQIEMICYYIQQKIMNKESNDQVRLHLIYFINDMIHHGNKKGMDLIKKYLEKVIISSFCYAIDNIEPEKRIKMNKLLELWDKNSYFSGIIIEKLKIPSLNLKLYEEGLKIDNEIFSQNIESEAQNQLNVYEKQNKDFIDHSNNQVKYIQIQINGIFQQQIMMQQQQQHQAQQIQEDFIRQQQQQNQNFQGGPPQSLMTNNFGQQPQQMPQNTQIPDNFNNNNTKPPSLMSLMSVNTNTGGPPPTSVMPPQGQQNLMSIPPSISDFTKPPPGFGPPPPGPLQKVTPQLPSDFGSQYYSLPAGLMVPLVKTSDLSYCSLNPKLIELPPPEPPSEKLNKALEEFYLPSSGENVRNSEGWEINGLYEFFKQKIKEKIDKRANKELEKEKKKNLKSSRKHSLSKSRSRSRSRTKRRSRSRSKSRSRSRSRGRKSTHRRRSYSSSSRSSRSRSRSRSSRSKSRSRSRSRSRSKSRRASGQSSIRSNKRMSRSRSPTTPRISQFTSASTPIVPSVSIDQRIDSSNKGHQLLSKMGYSGAGLGRKEQGIINPIKGGEVRDRNEQYRGVGVKVDPFDAFRKNKSQGYIQRLRTRDEIRKEENMKRNSGTNQPMKEDEYDY